MDKKQLLLIQWTGITLSASAYALSLQISYFSGLIWIFLLPLIVLFLEKKVTFCKGFIWGITFYILHVPGIWWWIVQSYTHGILIVSTFIFYLAFLPGVWFKVTQLITGKLKTNGLNLLIVLLSLWIYLVTHGFLYFVWFAPGYVHWLSQPGIALASSGFGELILQYAGENFTLGLIVGINGGLFVLYKKKKEIFYSIVTILMMLSIITPIQFSLPSDIGHISPMNLPNGSVYDQCAWIHEEMEKIPQDLIIMPESSLKFPLNQYPEVFSWWKKKRLIIGSHRKEGKKLYNCVYDIDHGHLKNIFDKQYPMLFIECLPTIFSGALLKDCFFEKYCEFNSSERSNTINLDNKKYRLYVCSDFFMRSTYKDCKSIVFTNDNESIFGFNKLYVYATQYHLVINQKKILFIGHQKILSLKS